MTRRSQATLLAGVLTTLLLGAAMLMPLPYVVYQPGSTVDLLSEDGGTERIRVSGHPTYSSSDGDDGELRMTTIIATPPGSGATLPEALLAWVSRDEAVKPYDAVYAPEDTEAEKSREGAAQMATSRDVAIAVALDALDIDVQLVLGPIAEDLPADGRLQAGDRVVAIGGDRIGSWTELEQAIVGAPEEQPLDFTVVRDGERLRVPVTPAVVDGENRVGLTGAAAYVFPFEITIDLGQDIGGPSAGMMFALALYDTLTPGDLTGGASIAGTGEINLVGAVGSIGGIQQKIAGARDAGVDLFLVPLANCAEAVDAPNDDVRLAAVGTLDDALKTITAYAADRDADLTTCEEVLADE